MPSKLQIINTLLVNAEKEIEANGKMSKESQDKLFAMHPKFQEAWPDIDKISIQVLEEHMVELTGLPLERLRGHTSKWNQRRWPKFIVRSSLAQ